MKNLNNKLLSKDIKSKGILYTRDYVEILNKKNQITKQSIESETQLNETKPKLIESEGLFLKNKSFLSSIIDIFSLKTQIKNKISRELDLSVSKSLKEKSFQEVHPILGYNINDPIIDESYILECFDDLNIKFLLNQISPEYIGTEHQSIILNNYSQHLKNMYNALNSEKVDVEFIKKNFLQMYSIDDPYNGQLRGQKIRHDILMFQEAFNKNPEKFENLDDLIPVNLAMIVDVLGCSESNIICHSIGGKITADSLKYAHEILISRAISAKFNIRVFVKLDQNDEEINSVLEFFSKIGNSCQTNTDIVFLDEDNMTFSEWDIKNEYLKLVVSRKFAQQVIQLGNYPSDISKEKFNDNYVLDLLKEFEKNIKSPKTTVEQRALLIKRHTELVSYLFSKDPLLLVPNGNKNFFSSIKLFIDLSSYFKS